MAAALSTDPVMAWREGVADGRRRGAALAELCRPRIARVPVLVFVAAGWSADLAGRSLVGGGVVIVAACCAASALNDRADVETDRVNGRMDRPLVSGDLGERDVVGVVAVSGLTAAIAQVLLPQPLGAQVTLAAVLVGLLSAREPVALQRRGAVGLLALAIGYLVLPVALAAGWSAAARVLPLALVGAGVLAHKDVRDLAGDRAAGKRTVVVRWGVPGMCRWAVAWALAGSVLLAVTVGLGWWCFGAVWALVELALMVRLGHHSAGWTRSRIALISTTVAVAVSASASGGAASFGVWP